MGTMSMPITSPLTTGVFLMNRQPSQMDFAMDGTEIVPLPFRLLSVFPLASYTKSALAAGLVPPWLAGPAVWGATANCDDCAVAWRQVSVCCSAWDPGPGA